MADNSNEVICPDVELLTRIETNVLCTVPGCCKVLPNTSSLRMHLLKTHKVVAGMKEGRVFEKDSCGGETKKKIYCCPVDGCVRGKNTGRHFNRLSHVKQHYMTIHGDKQFMCSICGKKFGNNNTCLRHQKTCGTVFACSCGISYNSRTSLLNHAKRTRHALPSDEIYNEAVSRATAKARKTSTLSSNATQDGSPVCFSIIHVPNNKKIAALRPLRPKKLLVNTETQTDVPCVCNTDTMTTHLVQNGNSSQVDNIISPRSIAVGTCTQPAGSMLCNEKNQTTDTQTYTQTMDEAYTQTIEDVLPNIDSNCRTMTGVFTQTMNEASTRTMDTQTALCATSESNCQTMDKVYSMDEAYTQTSFIADENFSSMDFSLDNEEFKELTHSQTQTSWGLAFEGFPLFEDNETQTLESYLDNFDPANITSDCATQTKTIFDDIFSVDMETQTLLPLINLTDEGFNNHSCNPTVDHPTQTLESIYLDSHS